MQRKNIVLIIGIILFMVLGFCFFNQNKDDYIMRVVLSFIYKNYLDKRWPIFSRTDVDPAVLNVAFPDESIIYYVNSFKNSDRPYLRGKMPQNIYFWSLTIYDQDGKPFTSVNDSQFPSTDFLVNIDPANSNTMKGNIYKMKAPSKGSYCVIQRVYKSFKTPSDLVPFLPQIIGLDRKLEEVTDQERIIYSNKIQNLMYTAFSKKIKDKTAEQLFPGVETTRFFLPSEKQVSVAFPNPFTTYLISFPKKDQVIRVVGKLPFASKENTFGTRFISFMASDMTNTATDHSISMETMKMDTNRNYSLFVAFSLQKAIEAGYDSKKDNLLLWNPSNPFPVLIYRILSTETTPIGIFAIDNTNNVDGSTVRVIMGEEYPECF